MIIFHRVRDGYVRWHADRIRLPAFPESPLIRRRVYFSGKVQKVGFRLELSRLAERLNLTGSVKNREDGSVEAVLQGEERAVQFLVKCMIGLKRASVARLDMQELPVLESLTGFQSDKEG